MTELLVAAAIFLVLLFVAFGGGLVHWTVLFTLGAAVTAVGLTVGAAVGLAYHVALYRALAPLGTLGPDWWWRPARYNARLPVARRRAVMGLFYAGVVSMAVDLIGCALVLAGILIM